MTPRSATATKPELSRAAIVERALCVMDEQGPDAVTIRGIATSLGVTPMALYWHVANKDELLAAMGDAIIDRIVVPTPTGPWSQQLRHVILSMVDALQVHPAAADLVLPRILVNARGLELTEFVLTLLQRVGFTVQQSADIARMGLQIAMVLVAQRPGAETQTARDDRDALLAEKRRHLLGLPERFAHVREAGIALTTCDDPQAHYRGGVDLYVEGVEALLRRRKRDRRQPTTA